MTEPKLPKENGTDWKAMTTAQAARILSPYARRIGSVIGWFQYAATKCINDHFGTAGEPVFQRSFHDHIIRGDQDYKGIRKYIDTNPVKWKVDCFFVGEIR